MTSPWIVPDLASALAEHAFPTITMWNRMEGRPRTEQFDRALRVEVRDALWMLTRQWQLGELTGDDAGSPIFAKVHTSTTRLRDYRAGSEPAEPFDDTMPLETRVEARPVTMSVDDRDMSLDLRLLLGRHWLKLLAPLGDFTAEFVEAYQIHRPDPASPEDALYCAHPEAWSTFTTVSRRRMDGGKLYAYLTADSRHHAWDGIAALDPHRAEVDALAERFVVWFRALIHQPSTSGAWQPDRLEYAFACAAPAGDGAQQVLVADEYAHGHLDWYAVDTDPDAAAVDGGGDPTGLPAPDTQVVIPTGITFDGMPNTRWWAFEDGRTNFGDIRPDTTDLAKLLLIEFGLVYANDWFLIPHTLPAGSVRTIRGLAVTNVFGERTWVEPAGSGPNDDWQRWAMFLASVRGTGTSATDPSLVLLPTTVAMQEGTPVEEVLLVRDEVANMVWGVETAIPLPTGRHRDGRAAAREFHAYLEAGLGVPVAPVPPAGETRIRYEVMHTVPEQWIPFVPVHLTGDNREVQLQRAALPRVLSGAVAPPGLRKVQPRTALLREGLDATPALPYFLHEEEVPACGVRLTLSYQRTRWRDGRVWVWLGVQKRTGRGGASSGLMFDRAVDLPPPDG